MAGDPTSAYYIAGTVTSIAAVVGGARAYYSRQRQKWTDEGARNQRNTEALEANTRAAAANTAAMAELVTKFDRFADETRTKINGHDVRIGRLEDVTEGPLRTRRHNGDGT